MDNVNRFLALGDGDDYPAAARGLSKFFEECDKKGDGVIVVPQIMVIEGGILKKVLGPEFTKLLARERTVRWSNSNVSICSDKTLKNFRRAKVYAAMWSRTEIIDQFEEFGGWRSLTWVTWKPEEADKWRKKI